MLPERPSLPMQMTLLWLSWVPTGIIRRQAGFLNASNPLYYIKPSKPFIEKLSAIGDPRRDRWFQPVLNKWDVNVAAAVDKTVNNAFGETYTVKYMPAKPRAECGHVPVCGPAGWIGGSGCRFAQ